MDFDNKCADEKAKFGVKRRIF